MPAASAVQRADATRAKPPRPIANAALVLALLGMAAAIVYGNALRNGFVFDDYELVVENVQIRSLGNIPEILGLGDAPRRYRPVRFVSYAVDYFLFGPDAWGFHLANVIYHVLSAFLVYLIVRRLSQNARVALLAALVFLVHPVQTDAVTYVSGRRDVLSSLFYLLGFYAFLRYRAEGSAWFLALVPVAFVLGLFTKEMVVTLPVMMLTYDWYAQFAPGAKGVLREIPAALARAVRRYRALYLPMLALVALFLFEKLVLHNPSRMEGLYGDTWVLHFLTVCRILATYVGLLVFPAILNADYSYNAFPVTTSVFELQALAALLLIGLLAAGLVAALGRAKLAAFAGLWFFITLLPVSQIVPHHEMMAEHYLYLPSVGFALLVALGGERLIVSARSRRYAIAGLGAILVLLSARSVVRNLDWRDDITLWEKTVETAPRSSRAHSNLATAYARLGEVDRAIESYLRALEIWPRNLQAYIRLGDAYYVQGRLQEARKAYESAVRLKPDHAKAHFRLGRLFGRIGAVDEALNAFLKASHLQPRYAEAHHELATAYYKKGQLEKAREHYRRTLELDRGYVSAHSNLAIIHEKEGDLDQAIGEFEAVLRIRPEDIEARLNLVRLLLRVGADRQEALHHLREVLVRAPQHPQAPAAKRMIDALSGQPKQ